MKHIRFFAGSEQGNHPARGEGAGQQVRVAVVGNPNSGKTTLFNALTGLRQKVGNYPGVTVEKKEGTFDYAGTSFRLVDLPGSYSLTATSDDERVVRDMLLGLLPSEPAVDIALVVVDATNLDRQLFLATQVMDLGLPMVIGLTMNDEAARRGRVVDAAHLEHALGVPVVEVVAPKGQGIEQLRRAVAGAVEHHPAPPPWSLGERTLSAVDRLAERLGEHHPAPLQYRRQLALQLLMYPESEHPLGALPGVAEATREVRAELESGHVPWRGAEAQGRYAWITRIAGGSRAAARRGYSPSRSDRLDAVVTHPVWGLLIFIVVMGIVFQAIFSLAVPFMDAIDRLVAWLGDAAAAVLPDGPLEGLVVDGVIGGVGAVVTFLPQILLLFLCIAILEDSGYMARAAYLMNKHMRRAGLHGRAFIPLLSGFACSIPGIMAARTISDRREKLITILVTPLVSCSARLPVYALMIAAFIPAIPIFGSFRGFTLQGLVLWGAYLFSLAAAITAAFVLRKTILKGPSQPFILELPPYRVPHWQTVLIAMWERGKLFLTQAGTIILAINIILWFLLTFPADRTIADTFEVQRAEALQTFSGEALEQELAILDSRQASAQLRSSVAGRLGRLLEPLIKPLGFDWKIGVGLIGSFAAREVFVSTLAIVYGVGDQDGENQGLISTIRSEISPDTGRPVYNVLVALNIVIFFILACQCMATIAVVKRETNSWGWPLFMVAYMTGLAWLACFVFYQVASRLWPQLA